MSKILEQGKPIAGMDSRELSDAVAEEVLGWTQLLANSIDTWGFPPQDKGVDVQRAVVPGFAWDMSAAMEVVDAMINHHNATEFLVSTLIPNSDAVVFSVAFCEGVWCSDFSLANAICKAALEVVRKGQEVKG